MAKKLMKGGRWIKSSDIPPEPPNLGRQLAHIVHGRAKADPDAVLRAWFTALSKSMAPWPHARRSIISASAFQDSLQFVSEEIGIYHEGLILREQDQGRPQPAIWVSTDEEIVCFTHDLSMPHAMAGLPFSDSTLSALFHCQGIQGPYLFSKAQGVLDIAVPRDLQMFGPVPPKRFH